MVIRKKGIMSVFCECGTMIPIVPDIEEMFRYIQAHAEIHTLSKVSKVKRIREYDRIEHQLIAKVLTKIADSECRIELECK